MEKVLLFSTKREIYDLIRNIFRERVKVSCLQNEEMPASAESSQFLLTDCDYECRIDRCLKKFTFLSRHRNIPSAMIRPILLKDKAKEFPGFYLIVFNDNNTSAFQKRVLSALKSSRYYAGSSVFSIPTFSPLYKIIQVQRKIAESSAKSVSLSSLAQMTGCSPGWLSLNFRDLTGISLRAFRAKITCCQALWQIISTEKPIKSIALEAGYEPLYFSKLFHRIFDLPPSSLIKLLWRPLS